jgi:hypothetical protein
MPDKFVELFKCPFIEEQLDTLAGRELAFLVLPLAAFSTAADFRFCIVAAQFFKAIVVLCGTVHLAFGSRQIAKR